MIIWGLFHTLPKKKTNHQPAMMGLDFGLFLLHIGRSESPVYGKPEKWSVVKKKASFRLVKAQIFDDQGGKTMISPSPPVVCSFSFEIFWSPTDESFLNIFHDQITVSTPLEFCEITRRIQLNAHFLRWILGIFPLPTPHRIGWFWPILKPDFQSFPDQKNLWFPSMENPVFRIPRHQSIDPTRLHRTPPEVDMKSIDALREMKDKLQTALKANGKQRRGRQTSMALEGVQWFSYVFIINKTYLYHYIYMFLFN